MNVISWLADGRVTRVGKSRKDHVVSDNTLDLDQTERAILTDDVSDEELEAATGVDQRLREITAPPIWCPDSVGCK
jgi:hypothetical protein